MLLLFLVLLRLATLLSQLHKIVAQEFFVVGRVLLCDDEDDVWRGFHTKWMYLVLFLQKELKRPIGTNDPLMVVFGS